MTAPAPGVPVCYRHAGREAGIRCQRCDRPICPECMRDAAVGFQCPSCVKEGSRSTRQDRSAYGGRRSADASLTSYVLIGANLALWLLVLATGWRRSPVVDRLALLPRGLCESVSDDSFFYRVPDAATCATVPDGHWIPGVAHGAYWELLTSAFMHVELWHIAGNMLTLYLLGPQLERILGRTRFLAVYVLSALSGSAVVYWLADVDSSTLGASGALFGLFGALAVVARRTGADLRSIAGLIAINAVLTFTVPNVSWQGHLGGLVGGVLTTAIIVHAPRGPRRAAVQWSGLAGVLALVVVAVVLRTAQLA